jgi:hypothetical protein
MNSLPCTIIVFTWVRLGSLELVRPVSSTTQMQSSTLDPSFSFTQIQLDLALHHSACIKEGVHSRLQDGLLVRLILDYRHILEYMIVLWTILVLNCFDPLVVYFHSESIMDLLMLSMY